ncbi:ABC transporter ATP-binding protein [Croceicoccus sp. F390]|uniref:ABC transporter ATP-binding protein n=1 Tax=Croceicoccus esteveae TaxID=3075597 RepID=A0ABU2ZK41_9SPHN|nr:ABC transporter ATP-binding protein [Croceicoccus sp. F390]MDT0575939.1 ABC transporter ATP-binding protein [Croceicoccus sp. F390]
MTLLKAEALSYTDRASPLVQDASLTLEAVSLVMLIGPNGSGKTPLLSLLLAGSGICRLLGTDIARIAPSHRARIAAYLPQSRPMVWPQPVRDIVALGRFAHGGAPARLSLRDHDTFDEAMTACAVSHFAERAADTLSGGELARVHLARALATKTPLLVAANLSRRSTRATRMK